MSNKKKTPAKKKPSGAKKKPSAKKKQLPKVDKIEIDVPSTDEIKELVTDTFKSIQAEDFKWTPTVKKGLLARLKSWFKVS